MKSRPILERFDMTIRDELGFPIIAEGVPHSDGCWIKAEDAINEQMVLTDQIKTLETQLKIAKESAPAIAFGHFKDLMLRSPQLQKAWVNSIVACLEYLDENESSWQPIEAAYAIMEAVFSIDLKPKDINQDQLPL